TEKGSRLGFPFFRLILKISLQKEVPFLIRLACHPCILSGLQHFAFQAGSFAFFLKEHNRTGAAERESRLCRIKAKAQRVDNVHMDRSPMTKVQCGFSGSAFHDSGLHKKKAKHVY
ncbi:hypothetical protein, partial [Prevotella multiformis]|uniref:hypothetical protein n=1 Tax=Prevotella multiformis TaxID=282402 RepID=UPI0023F142FD